MHFPASLPEWFLRSTHQDLAGLCKNLASFWHPPQIILEHLDSFTAENSTSRRAFQLWLMAESLLFAEQVPGNLDTVVATSDVDIKQGETERGTFYLNNQTKSKCSYATAAWGKTVPASCLLPTGGLLASPNLCVCSGFHLEEKTLVFAFWLISPIKQGTLSKGEVVASSSK